MSLVETLRPISVGVWACGRMGVPIIPSLHHSITPVFIHSIISSEVDNTILFFTLIVLPVFGMFPAFYHGKIAK